jgi:Nucleotidyl transferase AbiEii toxin, Type IV TA system
VGFDNVTPNNHVTISSWAYDKAVQNATIDIIDNRALNIACYHPGFTFVEKLQTIATKFRKEQKENAAVQPNYMRQYYDVYSLLDNSQVTDLIGTPEYEAHKKNRFPPEDYAIPIAENEAFILSNHALRDSFRKRYLSTKSLYYNGQPTLDEMLVRINEYIKKL